jgi:hypothetical protein
VVVEPDVDRCIAHEEWLRWVGVFDLRPLGSTGRKSRAFIPIYCN